MSNSCKQQCAIKFHRILDATRLSSPKSGFWILDEIRNLSFYLSGIEHQVSSINEPHLFASCYGGMRAGEMKLH